MGQRCAQAIKEMWDQGLLSYFTLMDRNQGTSRDNKGEFVGEGHHSGPGFPRRGAADMIYKTK